VLIHNVRCSLKSAVALLSRHPFVTRISYAPPHSTMGFTKMIMGVSSTQQGREGVRTKARDLYETPVVFCISIVFKDPASEDGMVKRRRLRVYLEP